MPDTKITALTALTGADPANDVIPIVDVNDTIMAGSGTTKKISINNILGAGGTATLASATITGNLTVDTNTLFVDSANNRVGIGTATPNWLLTASGSSPEFVMIDSGANGTRLYTKTTNTAVFIGANYSTSSVPINFTLDGGSSNSMTLNSTGLGVGVTPTAGRGAVQLSAGVGFPATQVASTDPNTLDDYEEGTWTGTLNGGTTNPTTPVTATGRYTKIGRQVFVEIHFNNVDTTGASGQIIVTGAPFASNGSVGSTGAVMMSSIGSFSGIPVAFIGTGTTEIALYTSSSAGALAFVTHNAGTSRSLWMSFTYSV